VNSEDDKGPILYKCPYCAAGRFRAPNGWQEAIQHIRRHSKGWDKGRGKKNEEKDEEAVAGHKGILFDEVV
jgi:uncharacterized C2H2 Zn-finger protein